jgi:rhamnose utilization protein RhaD (predicted bifunctional aldolase and dehydrogenase)
MNPALREVSEQVAACATDRLLIQGAGGNVSLKDGDTFWVKASGTWLLHADREDLFVGLDWTGMQEWLETGDERVPSGLTRHNPSLRPSIETSFHVAMPHRVVLHTHPVDLVTLAVRTDAETQLQSYLRGFNWAWVPYARPGRRLTAGIQAVLSRRNADILVLGNHGVIVGADTIAEAVDVTKAVVERCAQTPRPVAGDAITDVLGHDPVCFDLFNRQPNVLYPDQAVFLGDRIPDASTAGPFLVSPNTGVLIAAGVDLMVPLMLQFHAEVLRRIPPGAPLNYLTAADIDALLDWDAEKYRQSLRQPL